MEAGVWLGLCFVCSVKLSTRREKQGTVQNFLYFDLVDLKIRLKGTSLSKADGTIGLLDLVFSR
jgi:hypothetical protein